MRVLLDLTFLFVQYASIEIIFLMIRNLMGQLS